MLFSLCLCVKKNKNCSHMEIFSFVTVKELLKRIKKTKWCSAWWDRWFIRELRVSHWSEFSARFKNRPQKVRQWQLPVCATSRSWAVQRRLIISRQEMFIAFYWILTTYLCLLMSSYNLPVRLKMITAPIYLDWNVLFFFLFLSLLTHQHVTVCHF